MAFVILRFWLTFCPLLSKCNIYGHINHSLASVQHTRHVFIHSGRSAFQKTRFHRRQNDVPPWELVSKREAGWLNCIKRRALEPSILRQEKNISPRRQRLTIIKYNIYNQLCRSQHRTDPQRCYSYRTIRNKRPRECSRQSYTKRNSRTHRSLKLQTRKIDKNDRKIVLHTRIGANFTCEKSKKVMITRVL